MKTSPLTKVEIEAEQVSDGSRRSPSLEQLGTLAERLPWVSANVFIMPPHQYVVEKKLKSQEEREAFESLRDSCAHHPNRWKAFFRAYKTKDKANIDLWSQEIAPNTELRKWFDRDSKKWRRFRGRYQTELKHHPEQLATTRSNAKKGTVTLIYGARDQEHNEALVLKQFLEKR